MATQAGRLLRSRASWLLAAALVAVAMWFAWRSTTAAAKTATVDASVVLVESAADDETTRAVLQAWQDVLAEEGFRVARLQARDIERQGLPHGVRGVILPDMAATRLGDRTVAELYRHVREGGRLLATFDAGTRTESDAYSPLRSRLSDLVGVAYARYHEQRESIFHHDVVKMTPAGLAALAVQPGKTTPTSEGPELKAYGYEHLLVPMFSTAGTYRGEILAASARGDVVVGRSSVGQGEVLFVNAPAGWLKTRSDGYLLHQSLRLFMGSMLREPQLLAVPDGIGGMVMNVHIDSGASIAPLKKLEDAGVFREGPWSLHFTAGPDTYRKGDRAGLDLDNNAWARGFVSRMRATGHEIGSHGGWSHNEFGLGVDEHNRARFEPYLALNASSVEHVTGEPQRVYSAPVGNQPLWVNQWLDEHGFVAYYDTGGGGLGPTRSWRDGRRVDTTLWSFPVANFGSLATFEELDGLDDGPGEPAEVAAYRDFASGLIDFTARERVVRLTYFHAPAGVEHRQALNAWVARASQLRSEDRFRWYRMEDLARFLTRRELARWSHADGRLVAAHPQSLAGLTWLLRGVPAEQVKVVEGQALVETASDGALVHATGGRTLAVETTVSTGVKAP